MLAAAPEETLAPSCSCTVCWPGPLHRQQIERLAERLQRQRAVSPAAEPAASATAVHGRPQHVPAPGAEAAGRGACGGRKAACARVAPRSVREADRPGRAKSAERARRLAPEAARSEADRAARANAAERARRVAAAEAAAKKSEVDLRRLRTCYQSASRELSSLREEAATHEAALAQARAKGARKEEEWKRRLAEERSTLSAGMKKLED